MAVDPNWDEPLPHSLTRRLVYGAWPSAQHTRAALVLLHGRGDNARDFAEPFVRTLRQRAPELCPSEQECVGQFDADDDHKTGSVSIVALEARDGAWWPAHHESTDDASFDYNHPYVWSALERLHRELAALVDETGIPASRLVLAGFSQGAILATTYVQAFLRKQPEAQTLIPPRDVFALAGTAFSREFAYPEGRKYYSGQEEQQQDRLPARTLQPQAECTVQLICGTNDRHFRTDQVEATRSELVRQYEASAWTDKLKLSVDAHLLPAAGHLVSPAMLYNVVDATIALAAS